MKTFSAFALTALLAVGGAAPANGPAAAPAAPAPSVATPAQDGYAWMGELLYQADMELTPNVLVAFTNDANCGAAISAIGAGGCTITLESGAHLVTISPALIETAAGKHVFFHELAHVAGIADECEAERYAAQFDEAELWSYPECAPMAADAE